MILTTISCDAVFLRCSSCSSEITSAATTPAACRTCGLSMNVDRRCGRSFALHENGLLIRCIAEHKDGWRCADGCDFCPDHIHLANRATAARAAPIIVERSPAIT